MITNFFPNNPRLCALIRLAFTILQPTLLVLALAVVFSIPHQAYLAYPLLFLAVPVLIARDAHKNHRGIVEHFRISQDCKILLGIGLLSLAFGTLASILYDQSLGDSEHYWMLVISNLVSFLSGFAASMFAVLFCFAFAGIYQWMIKTYAKYLNECETRQV